MFNMLNRWYQRKFSDPAAVSLFMILLSGFLVIYFGGALLAPILLALVLAYALEWPVERLEAWGVPRRFGATIVLLAFASIVLLGVLILVPIVWNQSVNLARELPTMVEKLQHTMWDLHSAYPEYVSREHLDGVTHNVRDSVIEYGQTFLSTSLQSLVSVVALLIYVVVVPLLMFFFLKDKDELIQGISRFLPANRRLANQVRDEMNAQIINYIRGKVLEILIVGITTYIFFFIIELRYSALLAVLVGLSVLIPYVGAALVTIPIAVVGLFQWGATADFGYLMLGYGVIQALDGNLLVPILFSEAVNLHPVLIIIAVLVFGGLWGFWGVFFAIPLATLVKAVINAWPTNADEILSEKQQE
ncbi:AI-2E family transporter [Echinimonas agarilytica]|uniref:AI-2E family transporter n=1 Tax=Echinimonas agarilytica TaxID=1215918 RepID=A0AA42B7G8_9GAMM|nr:AI-2E family transporter [Echinimonas agarilytica]MCM2679283.1 AI-2E family transporter [Echinimonas agarilytica]